MENSDSSLFANMSIAVDGGISLSYAYLIVNNIPVDDFSRGSVLLRVYPGDRIAVDASAYRRELTFCIEAVSVNVDRSVLNDKITANGDLIEIGTIRFR